MTSLQIETEQEPKQKTTTKKSVSNETKTPPIPQQLSCAVTLAMASIGCSVILLIAYNLVHTSNALTISFHATPRSINFPQEIETQKLSESPRPKRHIFIDLGANSGDTYASMLKGSYFDKSIDRSEVEAYFVEANPKWTQRLQALASNDLRIKKVR